MKVQKTILTWLTYWWFPDVNLSSQAINELFTKIDLWSTTKGELWVITHLKEIRLLYTRHLCGGPVVSSSHIIGIRKDGLPKGFPILNSIYLSGSREGVRFTLTLLSISRTIKAWKKPSTETITKPYSGLDFTARDFQSFISEFLSDHKVRVLDLNWSRKDFFYSTKSGPQGLATWHAITDATKMPNSLVDKIQLLSTELYSELLNWRTFDGIALFEKFNIGFGRQYLPHNRKLSVVKDPEGKSRVIAIFDYWTQNIMKKLHNDVLEILRTLPQDRTFTQDPTVDFNGPYYSFDLSAATDRFPLKFQEILVKNLLNSKSKAKAWSDLLVEEEFYVPWTGQCVKYAVGQPMGAYSSWAVFALSHHIIVQYCAKLIGEYPTKNYILLGDDIVIGGKELADTYRSVVEALGVEISPHKTHVSTNTYEFAKRWFKDGIEVSGIQVNAFMETWKSYPLLFQVIRTYYERGLFPKRISTYPKLVESLLISMGVYARKAHNISLKVNRLHAFYRWIHDGDLRSIREVLIDSLPSEATLPDETHPIFKYLVFMRYDMAYQVMHKSLVTKVESFLNKSGEILLGNTKVFQPDQLEEIEEIDLDALLANPSMIPKSDKLGYSDVLNHPISLSLQQVHRRLSTDERISISQSDLSEAIKALVIPDIDRVGSKRRGADVLVKTNILAQKVIYFNKLLSPGRWMFEQQFIYSGGIPNEILEKNLG